MSPDPSCHSCQLPNSSALPVGAASAGGPDSRCTRARFMRVAAAVKAAAARNTASGMKPASAT